MPFPKRVKQNAMSMSYPLESAGENHSTAFSLPLLMVWSMPTQNGKSTATSCFQTLGLFSHVSCHSCFFASEDMEMDVIAVRIVDDVLITERAVRLRISPHLSKGNTNLELLHSDLVPFCLMDSELSKIRT